MTPDSFFFSKVTKGFVGEELVSGSAAVWGESDDIAILLCVHEILKSVRVHCGFLFTSSCGFDGYHGLS